MPRLIDDIRAYGVAMPPWVTPGKEREWAKYARMVMPMVGNPQLPVLLIDNVADYYLRGTDQEYWDLQKDFPNLAPPFPQFWCEHRMVRFIRSKEEGDTDLSAMVGPSAKVGVLITAMNPEEAKPAPGDTYPPECKWILWMDIFLYYDHGNEPGPQPFGPYGATFMMVDADGRIIDRPWMQTYCTTDPENQILKGLITWFYPSLLAVSFLHCKNVIMQDEAVDKPLAKKYHAKTNVWPTKYRTLVIEPLKQILRHQGGSDKHGLAKAMHICRGHFKDYREGRGLFGKYHQLVWQPSVVRGTKGDKRDTPVREIKIKV